MLSKEEIEYMKKFFNESITKDLINSEDLAIRFMSVALEYIDQLESDKQKLIELLEKANKEDTDTVKYYEKQRRLTTDDFYKKSYQTQIHKANSRREVRKHILEIVKGENQVTVK